MKAKHFVAAAATLLLATAPSLLSAQTYGQSECHCLSNQTTATDGQFQDAILVHHLPNQTWTITAVNHLYRLDSPQPPAAPIPLTAGTTLNEYSPGRYRIDGIRLNEASWTLTLSNGTISKSLASFHTCKYAVIDIDGPSEACINDEEFYSTKGEISEITDWAWTSNGSSMNGADQSDLAYQMPDNADSDFMLAVSCMAPSNHFGTGTACRVKAEIFVDVKDDGICQPVLPVTYEKLGLDIANDKATIYWQIADESNNAGWNVERSLNRKDWEELDFVASQQLARANYAFTDEGTAQQPVQYYRLKQVDFDGGYEYSKILTAQLSVKDDITVLANPITDKTLRLSGQIEGANIKIYHPSGQLLLASKAQRSLLLDIQPGIYLLSIETPYQTRIEKIMIP